MKASSWFRSAPLVVAVLAWSSVSQAQVLRNDGLPAPNPLFPDDNWWNRDIRCAPVDPGSATYLASIGGEAMHPDFGGDDPDNPPNGIYGMVYITVPGNQPRRTVTFVEFGSQSDTCPPPGTAAPCGYPIPDVAITEPKWIEGGDPGGGTNGDHHMLLVDRDNHILYELYHTHWNAGLSRWEAGSGAIFLLDRNGRRPETWTSADASGMAILPGLVRYDEVFGPDPEIRHALRMTTNQTFGYVYPASHDATTGSAADIPLGGRLRLKQSVNISGYPAYIQKIMRAMKTYGLIVADNGSDMYFQGTWNTLWDNGELNPAFDDLQASDFDVIQLGWDATKGDFNCQGQVDLLFDNLGNQSHELWLMNGATRVGGVVPVTPNVASPNVKVLGTDDFNLDSYTDLATWDQTTGAVQFWLMNGATRTGAAVPLSGPTLPTAWFLAASGDFTHDGWPDLLWRNSATQKLIVWTMNGTAKTGEILPSPDQAVHPNWAVVAALDLDGDLNLDLLWYNSTSGKIVRWRMDANVQRIAGEFTNPSNAGNNNWQVVAAGDLGAGPGGVAGTKDLIWRNATSGKLVTWYMDPAGNRTFGGFTTPDQPTPPLGFTVAGPK